MGMYTSHGYSNYKILREVYNYLLPVYGRAKLFERGGTFFFCGSANDYNEMLERTEIIRSEINN